ncbi:MAG: hypothetical protein WBF58_22710 [Xanthobacteraceae bacterium]
MQLRSNHSVALAALISALTLFGCANPDVFDSNEHWFSRPFDWTGRAAGYSYSELHETNAAKRVATANDLVTANGACAPPAAAPAPAAPQPPGAMPTPYAAPSLLGEGIALGMTECDVVYRAGAPSSVRIGRNANGDRTALLMFDSGPRAGTYRFEAGRLMDMDRPQTAESAPAPKTKVARKKKSRSADAEQVSTK